MRCASLGVLAGVMLLAGCDREAERREAQSILLMDTAVVRELKSSDTTGRIIYDPAPSLSRDSAMVNRPDLFPR